MRTLQEVLNDMKKAKPLAEMNPDIGDPRTYTGRATLKGQAQAAIENGKKELKELLRKINTYIAPVGSKEDNEKFAKFSTEEAGAITVNASEMYEKLADSFLLSLNGNVNFTGHQEFLFMQTLESTMRELEISDMPLVVLPGNTTIPNREFAVDFVKKHVRNAMGDALNKSYMEDKIYKKLLDLDYKANGVPVIVLNASTDEIAGFERGAEDRWTVYAPKLTNLVTSENTIKILTEIAKKVKENRNKTN